MTRCMTEKNIHVFRRVPHFAGHFEERDVAERRASEMQGTGPATLRARVRGLRARIKGNYGDNDLPISAFRFVYRLFVSSANSRFLTPTVDCQRLQLFTTIDSYLPASTLVYNPRHSLTSNRYLITSIASWFLRLRVRHQY